jgi:hypothetical protein
MVFSFNETISFAVYDIPHAGSFPPLPLSLDPTPLLDVFVLFGHVIERVDLSLIQLSMRIDPPRWLFKQSDTE